MSRLPIRLRLTLAFAAAMAIVLAAMGVLVYVRVGGALLASVDQTLRAQAREAVSHVAKDEHGGLVDSDTAAGTTLAQLVDDRGRPIRSTPPGLAPLISPRAVRRAARTGRLRLTVEVSHRSGRWRVLAVRPPGGAQTVVVARSLAARDETLDRLLRELLIVSPLALILASLAGYALAAAALRPVETMRRRAASVTPGTPRTSRCRAPATRSRGSRSRSTTCSRGLHASLEHERRFVADASHELRTPLALLRTELELALRRPRSHAELEQAIRSAAEETERLSRLAEDLLTIARVEQGRSRSAGTHRCGRPARGRSRPLRRACGATRARDSVRSPSVDVDVDPDRLQQALSNLIDNASPTAPARSSCTRSHATASSSSMWPTRPGLRAPVRRTRLRPFSRADEVRGGHGAGLGLSIVASIAAAHGGSAAAANRREGGADVWLEVPRIPSAVS